MPSNPKRWQICMNERCSCLADEGIYGDSCPACGSKTRPATQAEIENRGAPARITGAVAVHGRPGSRR